MLETTLATSFVPGSNVKGEVMGANWRFLLPQLRSGRVVSIGRPGPAAIAGLESACEELVILEGIAPIEVPDGGADAVLVHDARAPFREVERMLRPGGSVWSESSVPLPSLRVWLSPPGGEIGSMAPAADRPTVDYLVRHGKLDPATRRLTPSRVRQWAREHAAVAAVRRRRGSLAGPSSAGEAPAYLADVIGSAGLDPATARWGISISGQYSSKKVLAFLFAPDSETPSAIVKLTRAPAFNPRLENEYEALRLLAQRGIGSTAIPRALALEESGGLILVAEAAAEGVPFRLRSTGRADCPLLTRAHSLLLELSARTVERDRVTPDEAARVFAELLDRLVSIYAIGPEHEAFLRGQVATVAGSAGPFPVVFQHGDPGIWNALATPSGEVVMLDWEAAETEGVPLWDLFYFARSYASLSPRSSSRSDFLGNPALVSSLVEAVRAHRAATRLSPELVEPLFYTCWVHRALKEANRRPPDRLDDGHFVSLLRRMIDGRRSPALDALFTGAS